MQNTPQYRFTKLSTKRQSIMKNYIIGLLVCMLFTLFFAETSYAAWLTDYSGTLGDKKIGLTIATEDIDYVMGNSKVLGLHYYYTQHFQDIPLSLKKQEGRNIIFEEYAQHGELIGTFNLTFAKQDPQKHFHSKEDLNAEVLVGTWDSANGAKNYPVYLMMEDSVTGDGNGGRCGLDGQSYIHLQEKIRKFHVAAVNGDAKTLKKDFNFTLPHSPSWKKEIAKTVPHDLFCNYQGYMLGNGIIWFDSEGNIIH